MQHIKRLPMSVHSSLRSSVVLFDLPRVVEELVHNSLDAGASKVYISVSVRACYVKVEDDGCGITRDELVILGEKHATSKVGLMDDGKGRTQTLGFRGEALGSLSDISIVEIRTRARGTPNAYHKIIKGSRCLFLGIDDYRESVGTSVTARDLFYNQPVRRKLMLSSPKKVLHSVKKCVLRIALVHTSVSFRVTDNDSEEELVWTSSCSSPMPLVAKMFSDEVSSCLHEIIFSDQMMMLSGYISGLADCFTSKAFQYLYINSRFISKGPVHTLINNLASVSQYHFVHSAIDLKFQCGKRQKDRAYPAFMLNMCCPISFYDLNFEPSKTVVEFKNWDLVLTFFERAIRQFWQELSANSCQAKTYAGKVPNTISGKKRRLDQLHEHCYQIPSISSQEIVIEDNGAIQYQGSSKKHLQKSSLVVEPWFTNCDDIGQVHSCRKDRNSALDYNCENDHVHMKIDTDWINKVTVGVGAFDNNELAQGFSPDYHTSNTSETNSQNFEFSLPSVEDLSRSCSNSCYLIDTKACDSKNFVMSVNFSPEINQRRKIFFPSSSIDCASSDNNIESLSFENTIPHKIVDASWSSCNIMRRCQRASSPEFSSPVNSFSFWQTCLTGESMPDNGLTYEGTSFKCESLAEKQSLLSPYSLFSSPPNAVCFKKKRTSDKYLGPHKCIESMIHDRRKNENFCSTSDEDYPSVSFEDYRSMSFKSTNLDYNNPSLLRDAPTNHSSERLTSRNLDFYGNLDDNIDWFCLDTSDIMKTARDTKFKFKSREKDVINFQNVCCEQEFQACRLPSFSLLRSRRSHSAPPFYRGKCKFTLNAFRTTVADADTDTAHNSSVLKLPGTAHLRDDLSQDDLLQPYASQPCPEPMQSEVSEVRGRELISGNPTAFDTITDISGNSSTELVKWRPGFRHPTEGEFSRKRVEQIDDVLDISSGILHLSGSSLVPESIDRDCLQDVRVLYQLDKKFIPVMASGMLVIVDQHAADERIRLEELRRKVLSGEGTGITYLDSEKELVLPEMGYQLLQKYNEKIEKWGWIFSTQSQMANSFKKSMNLVMGSSSGVALVAVPNILGIDLSDKDLVEYIEQLVETDGSSMIPPSVLHILNSKACRGAIMFGDSLLPSECSLIMEELKGTSLCFQCAHGRPTTVPLLDMTLLHERLAKLKLQKEGTVESWHGLSYHKPSIRRAKMRLDSAKRFLNG